MAACGKIIWDVFERKNILTQSRPRVLLEDNDLINATLGKDPTSIMLEKVRFVVSPQDPHGKIVCSKLAVVTFY